MNLSGMLVFAGRDAEAVCRDAIADLDEALRRDPTNDEVLLRRGSAKKNRGVWALLRGEDASKWFQDALADFDARRRSTRAGTRHG